MPLKSVRKFTHVKFVQNHIYKKKGIQITHVAVLNIRYHGRQLKIKQHYHPGLIYFIQ